jgi:phosphoadenosine phosphosulfate reductase
MNYAGPDTGGHPAIGYHSVAEPIANAVDSFPEGLDSIALLRHAIFVAFPGRIAVSSSYGAESALLLALVAEVDRSVPVLFLDTGRHFAETLAYRDTLTAFLGLTGVRDLRPDPAALAREDPVELLYSIDPDGCCALRKVAPLEQALAPYDALITGRKRHQAATRRQLHQVESEQGRISINPLVDWDAARIAAEAARRGLPSHPLVARGYTSIGCEPCTRPVAPGEDPRSGRWAGLVKTECGIHRPAVGGGAGT